jgi:hypothetical protein
MMFVTCDCSGNDFRDSDGDDVRYHDEHDFGDDDGGNGHDAGDGDGDDGRYNDEGDYSDDDGGNGHDAGDGGEDDVRYNDEGVATLITLPNQSSTIY